MEKLRKYVSKRNWDVDGMMRKYYKKCDSMTLEKKRKEYQDIDIYKRLSLARLSLECNRDLKVLLGVSLMAH